MALGMVLLGTTAFLQQVSLIEISLTVFGAGFGVYTFGGVSLMAVMCTDKEAGAYLGLWSLAVLVSKGTGTFLGGAIRDLFLLDLRLGAPASYGGLFTLEAAGLFVAALLLSKTDVAGFAKEMGRSVRRAEAQIAAAD
jgi:BCD family chlorophyll transporter-like MFS transporter